MTTSTIEFEISAALFYVSFSTPVFLSPQETKDIAMAIEESVHASRIRPQDILSVLDGADISSELPQEAQQAIVRRLMETNMLNQR